MANIEFVRVYEVSNKTLADVIYKNGICVTYSDSLPQTVLIFLRTAKQIELFNPVFKQKELIYE